MFCANAQGQQADKKLKDRITEQHPQILPGVRPFLLSPDSCMTELKSRTWKLKP